MSNKSVLQRKDHTSVKSNQTNLMELTILVPCFNEEITIKETIVNIEKILVTMNINSEILVIDNNSTDSSRNIIQSTSARLLSNKIKGYGATINQGIFNALGKYTIMLDADGSYDYNAIPMFYKVLKENNIDIIIGNRFNNYMESGAMPFMHKYVGTPCISSLGRMLYTNNIVDYNCGMRGFKTDKIKLLQLKSTGMEYASEMIVKASIANYRMVNLPIVFHKDKRNKKGNLNPIRDGVRHLSILFKYLKLK